MHALAQLKRYGLLILVTALVVVAGIAVHQARSARAALALQTLADGMQRSLNDSTEAMLARTKADRDTLEALYIAKDKLQGTLIAGLRLHIAARDTTVIRDTLVTVVGSDSTRTARFRDSTFAGVVEGEVTAPPCCAPLGIRYSVHRPAFSPTVGFVRVGTRAVATVTWQGERVEIQAPFADVPLAPKRMGTFVEGGMVYPAAAPFLRTGGYVRLKAVSGFVAGEQTFQRGQATRVQVGLRTQF